MVLLTFTFVKWIYLAAVDIQFARSWIAIFGGGDEVKSQTSFAALAGFSHTQIAFLD
jgi:hypothetical protein